MAVPERRSHRFLWIGGLALLLLASVLFGLGSLRLGFLELDSPEGTILLYVLSTLVFLSFVVLGTVLLRSLLKLYAERQQGVLGSQFKTKLVVGALALSLLPAVALFFVSYALVNRTLAKWFPRPLEIVRDDARDLARALLHGGELRAEELARQLADDAALGQALARSDFGAAEERLRKLAEERRLAGAVLADEQGRSLAVWRASTTSADMQALLPALLEPRAPAARTGTQTVGEQTFHFARVNVPAGPRGLPRGVLFVATRMPDDLAAKIGEIESEARKYEAITAERKTYRGQAMLILLLLTVLVLFAATWAALFLSKQVTVPIQALAQATREVSRGNFAYRVETPAQDELGILVDSFNQMTAQLGESRRELEVSQQRLELAVAELERRRQWMEAILESIPTGVLTLNPQREVVSYNPAAARLLEVPAGEGKKLVNWLGGANAAAVAGLVDRAAYLGTAFGELEFRFRRRVARMAVTVSALRRGRPDQGYVLVLDDLTELLRAQKASAWQEVAQRIAHEIKNPLTPIQLSADRIRRYLEQQESGNEKQPQELRRLLGECAGQIALEVNGLKSLVDEFSRFARFPAAQLVPGQLNPLVEATVSSYQEDANGVRICAELDASLPVLPLDANLLRRALVNLLENALEAEQGGAQKEILVRTRHLAPLRAVELSVADNGRGIPAESKPRLFLPFFTTKTNGMGLGLAIVDRIVAEHHGVIRVEDNEPSGTRFVIELPTETSA